MTVQFAEPQNLRSCPERGGAREGAEPLREPLGVQRRRKCETSPPPYPGARPGLLRSRPRAPASEGLSSHPSAPLAPGTRRTEPGGNRDLAEQKDRAEYNDPPLLKRLRRPKFREPAAFRILNRTGRTLSRVQCPQPPPVLFLLGPSLPCLGSSVVPIPALNRSNPEPV